MYPDSDGEPCILWYGGPWAELGLYYVTLGRYNPGLNLVLHDWYSEPWLG